MKSIRHRKKDPVMRCCRNHDLWRLTLYAGIGGECLLSGGERTLPFVVGGILLVLVDQGTKLLAMERLQPGKSLALPGHLIYLTLVHNPGAAFGILAHATPLLVLLTCSVLTVVWFNRRKLARQPLLFKLGVTLGLAGAVGNLIDRLRLGYVIDFIDMRFWPVFNVADMSIVAGVFLLFWLLMGWGKGCG